MREEIGGRLRVLAAVPVGVRRWVRAQQRRWRLQWPRAGTIEFGGLRRVTPVSRAFGLDRGLPVDRYYIEQFLAAHAADMRGRVLEIGDDFYTRKFGGARVSRSDVLHLVEGHPGATIVADLTRAHSIPADTFDCVVLTQTLQMIYDLAPGLASPPPDLETRGRTAGDIQWY